MKLELTEWAHVTDTSRKSEAGNGVGQVAYVWEKDTPRPASRRSISLRETTGSLEISKLVYILLRWVCFVT